MSTIEQPQWWRNRSLLLALIPILAFAVKMVIASKITPVISFSGELQGGGWLGADGENYLTGAGSILEDGIFSRDSILAYWPAGYPLLIALLAKISLSHTLWSISILQSAFYAYASYYFIRQISTTLLNKYSIAIAIILAINPTLTLASLVVGYESAIASAMLMVVALILKFKKGSESNKLLPAAIAVGSFSALATFLQPRWILTTLIISALWALTLHSRKNIIILLIAVIAAMSIAPAALVLRNIAAGNGVVISNNLGITMSIGAGDKTTGSYARKGPTVACKGENKDARVSDSQLTRCVMKWYLANPEKGLKLFINKSIYFWSPWSGVLQNGTMKRNPWHLINPLEQMSSSSEQGFLLIQGGLGRAISWAWLIGGIALFFLGLSWLQSMGSLYRLLAWLCAAPVLASWLVAMATVGDHRFRLPTMTLSLLLQVLGLYALKKKAATGTFAHAE